MNKKVLKATFVVAIAMVSGINVFNAQKSDGLSDTILANVEALADDFEGGNALCPYKGYGCQVNYNNGSSIIYWGLSPNKH